jgi:hypothetical protein
MLIVPRVRHSASLVRLSQFMPILELPCPVWMQLLMDSFPLRFGARVILEVPLAILTALRTPCFDLLLLGLSLHGLTPAMVEVTVLVTFCGALDFIEEFPTSKQSQGITSKQLLKPLL